jgi:hypothetical protein
MNRTPALGVGNGHGPLDRAQLDATLAMVKQQFR